MRETRLFSTIAIMTMACAACANQERMTEPEEDVQAASRWLEKANIEAYGRAGLSAAEKAALEPAPPAERFDFLGYVDQLPRHELPAPIAAYLTESEPREHSPHRTKAEHDAQVEAEDRANQDNRGDLAVMLYADGRVFREKSGFREPRDDDVTLTSTQDDFSGHTPVTGTLGDKDRGEDTGGIQSKRLYGSDGRTLITSSNVPWRQVGVRLESDCPGCTSTAHPAPLCSGAAVGPRHILTAAHCVKYETYGTRWVTASPAGRGSGYSGNKYPYGRRDVVARVWPQGWSGSSSASSYYDYAILILDDINWSPGWVGFGTQSATNLDFRNINSAGYPGRNNDCADSPTNDGTCSGYMYRQYATTKSVTAGTIYHRHDTQGGNSGMPLYDYYSSSGNRYVRAVHHGVYLGHNAAHRIRSGSYGLICSTIEGNPSSYFNYGGC